MASSSSSARTAEYTLLQSWTKQPKSSSISSWLRTGLLLLVFTITTFVSFVLGRHSAEITNSSQVETDTNSEISFHNLPHTFVYNRTFSEGTHRTDQAWDALFPKQMGYFSHPQIAHGHRSTFSVYHYLHCLNGIRQGYWAVYDIATQETSTSQARGTHGHGKEDKGTKKILDIHNLPMMISPSHVRHCIDLLRQNLMCNADLTVEVKDDKAGGVHGFGTQHQCVDWEELGGWVGEWEHKRD
ncbi:hypothetical protein QBC37DRAFT_422416 [Rhypophila decipiens]|uniref:Uncharacterized protein n=1 Tax=Rhypophila decipiens TaxID=261697 RepID=A0AAN6YD25_9PEZI|nr:hypothetical protein QBC37DRAFT_422416 [Rhypophila decipiens]